MKHTLADERTNGGANTRVGTSASGFIRLFLVLAAITLAPLGCWALVDTTSRAAMIFVGVACLLAIGFPMFVRGRDLSPLEPIVLCTFAVAIGCTFRAVYIGFSDYYRADFLTFGQTYAQIANGGFWVAIALGLFAFGYVVTTGRVNLHKSRLLTARTVDIDFRFWVVAFVGVLMAVFSVYVFVRLFNIGLTAESISKKRQLETGEDTSSALGPVRLLTGFAASSLYVLVAIKLFRRDRWSGSHIVLAVLLFAASAVLPFISSSRSSLGVILLNCLALVYLAGRLRLGLLVAGAVVILGMVTVMGNLRSDGREAEAGATALDAVVGSGNFVDLARTAAINDRVPDAVPYQNGKTYAALVTAPIPSSTWPDKPAVSLGPWVKSEVFGQRTIAGGWPPGVLGEGAINFGIPGMLFISLLVGALLRFIYNSFEPLLRTNAAAAVLYVSIFWPIGSQLIGLSLANGILRTVQSVVPAVVVIYLTSRRQRSGLPPEPRGPLPAGWVEAKHPRPHHG